MGLAASQARLLSITSRMADNELRSQSINNAKMRLASESALASENYINALNDANMMFSNYAVDGTSMNQKLTYNALMSYSSYNNQYGLVNSAGQILVSEAEAELFAQANGNLNAYLLAHGIEYDTTYFDKGIDGESIHIENPDYPQEFQNIPTETLKTWYENYDSYVNSAEYNYYNQYLSQYLDDSRAYRGSLRYMLDDYIGAISNGINNIPDNAERWAEEGNKAVENIYKNLEKYFTNTDEDGNKIINTVFQETYNKLQYNLFNWVRIQNRQIAGTIGVCYEGTTKTEATNNATQESGSTTYKYYFGWDSRELKETGSSNYTNYNGEEVSYKTYTPQGVDTRNYIAFTIYQEEGKNKCKVYSSYDENHGEDKPYYTTTENENGVAGYGQFKEYVKDAQGNYVKDENGNYKTQIVEKPLNAYEYALYQLDSYNSSTDSKTGDQYGNIKDPNGNNIMFDYDGSQSIYVVYESLDKYKELLNNAVRSLTSLAHNDNYFNIATFGNDVIQDYEQSLDPSLNINYNKDIKGSGMKYSDYIKNYEEAAITYFGLIEGKKAENPDDIKYSDLKQFGLFNLLSLKNAQETYEHFVDIDTLLELIKDHEKDSGDTRIEYSDEFRNIVRACIIDGMVDEYGEPKYTWIDRTDTTNTGNASAKAQWYTNLFERMQKGYKIIEKGLAASSEWIEFALQTGIVTIEQVDKSYIWRSIEYTSCTNISEQTDSTNVAVAKAEAEYNKVMREIEAKDRAFDMELKNIDTEHTALEKEYDSIKNAVKSNIERTMKFDQSS